MPRKSSQIRRTAESLKLVPWFVEKGAALNFHLKKKKRQKINRAYLHTLISPPSYLLARIAFKPGVCEPVLQNLEDITRFTENILGEET